MSTDTVRLAALCTSLLFYAISSVAATPPAPKEDENYGKIHFIDSEGKPVCALDVPKVSELTNFDSSATNCENDRATSFWLEKVDSATLIEFYENEACSDNQSKSNFYFKLKTVKQPTHWYSGEAQIPMRIDELRAYESPGELISGKYTRVEESFVGKDLLSDDLDERLSCVYIERSQPVN